MKHRLLSHVSVAGALVVVGLIASGCKSSTEPGGGGCGNSTTPTQSMSAQLDGKSWASNTTQASFGGGVLSITGQDNCNPNNFLTFALVPSGNGTYNVATTDFSGLNAIMLVGSAATWSAAPFSGGSGSVTLTTINSTTAVGSFNFTLIPSAGTGATGNHTFSAGSFNVKF